MSAAAGNGSARLTWTAPASGGKPITSYTITPYVGTEAQQTTTVPAPPPPAGTVVTGLQNGTSYTFVVTANNELGAGAPSEPSSAITPEATITEPAAPTEVSAAAGNASVTLKWSEPANGGSPITRYRITPYIGGVAQQATTLTGSPPATGTTLTGLTNGTSYTFTVKAANALGFGPESEPSAPVTPATTPSTPSILSTSAGNGSVTLKWSEPSNGGSPITAYTVTPYVGGVAQKATTVEGSPPAITTTITGLVNGTAYTFKVTATNALGSSPESEASAAVTPAAAPSAPGNVAVSAATKQALLSWSEPSSNGGSPITGYRITPFIGATAQTPVEVSPSASSTIVKNLLNGTAYTFTVTAVNAVGAGTPSSSTPAVTPQDTIFDFATPATIAENDPSSVELGVKFTSEVPGTVTGMRFYKASTNTGTHLASLWTAGGTLLASATFSNESASGWQQVNFSSPVAISANTTYVAGYLAPKGHYSDTASAFTSSPFANPPLSALSNVASANGVYAYSASSTFPTNSFKASNYYVDVDFEPGAATAPGQVAGVSASAATKQALLSWSEPTSNGSPITGYRITPFIGTTAQTPVEVGAASTSTTIKNLTNGTAYTFTVAALNALGAGPASSASPAVTPEDTIFDYATPAITDSGDGSSVTVGVKFSSEVAGTITGIRFYKASTNVGAHVADLWSSTGTLLASAPFSGETASGWQQVNFATPVAISAKTTYVAGYLAPKGHYSDTASGFTSAVSNPPLSALASSTSANGVYAYGGTSTFPTNSFKATNYFVDVDFEPSK